MADRRTPGQRAGLSRAAVLAVAGELVAESGLGGLSMRTLAARLGVTPNAIYSYTESRTALIDELLDDALAAVRAPDPAAGDPVEALHALMASTYDVLLAHGQLIPGYLGRQGARGPNAVRLGEIMLSLLDRSGVTGADARQALHVLIVHTIGAAAFATRSPLPADIAPEETEDHRAEFEGGLRWLLIGISSKSASAT